MPNNVGFIRSVVIVDVPNVNVKYGVVVFVFRGMEEVVYSDNFVTKFGQFGVEVASYEASRASYEYFQIFILNDIRSNSIDYEMRVRLREQ